MDASEIVARYQFMMISTGKPWYGCTDIFIYTGTGFVTTE